MELNEEQQTEAVFKSMRSEVDPVSGNEVPPGSLPEEVRDDIPAMLSEGEYVVPADVLRFYGMKFFEDLRNEAKRGLADMESNGRIGGEPVEGPAMGGGEELTPEERAEIESMVMAVGGYVPNPADMQQQPDPYAQQQAMYNVGKPVAVGNTGFAEGGTVPDDTQVSTADYATRFAPGFTFLEGSNASEFSTVTLYGPNGEVVTLTLPTDQARYEDLLQAGYSTEPAGGATTTGVTTETTVGKEEPEGREGGGPDGGPNGGGSTPSGGESLSEMSNDQLASSAKAIGIMGKVGAVALGPLGTAALGTVAAARYNDILDEMNYRGLDTTGMSRKGSVFGGEESLLGGLDDTNNDGTVNFGDTFVGDLLGFDGKFGVQDKGLKSSWSGGRRSGAPLDATGSADRGGYASVGDTFGAGDLAGYSDSSGKSGGTDFGGGDGPEGGGGNDGGFGDGMGIGGLYKKGGLVQRPTKKKKK